MQISQRFTHPPAIALRFGQEAFKKVLNFDDGNYEIGKTIEGDEYIHVVQVVDGLDGDIRVDTTLQKPAGGDWAGTKSGEVLNVSAQAAVLLNGQRAENIANKIWSRVMEEGESV